MAALEMLNIMEQFKPDPAGPYSPGELHKRIEAMKLAYADVTGMTAIRGSARSRWMNLLSKEYAAKRAKLIDPAKANCDVQAGSARSRATRPT